MGLSQSSFYGKDLPTSIWQSKVLYLPSPLVTAHKCFLEEKGWWENYNPSNAGGVGGESNEEAKVHVINRFLNSAARMQFVCADPANEQTEIREMVLDQLGEGHIYLLDLAAGNGAGTLAMLSLISELRASKNIPKLPLNICITGVDYSTDALIYYSELLDKVTPWFESNGLKITLSLSPCDLTVSGDFSEVFEQFLDDAKKNNVNRILCVISAMSGAKKEGMELMQDSLKIAAAGLSHKKRSSSWLWVEPHNSKSWITKIIDSVRLTLQKVAHRNISKGDSIEIKTDVPLLDNQKSRSFDWLDPHKSKTTTSHVIVMAFRNE